MLRMPRPKIGVGAGGAGIVGAVEQDRHDLRAGQVGKGAGEQGGRAADHRRREGGAATQEVACRSGRWRATRTPSAVR